MLTPNKATRVGVGGYLKTNAFYLLSRNSNYTTVDGLLTEMYF